MTPETQVGQLLCVGFDGTSAAQPLKQAIRAGQVGGVILFARNIEGTPEQLARLTNELQTEAGELPLFVAIDEEGGPVQRLRATAWPSAARLGVGAPAHTRRIARALGQEIAAVGCNIDFAPVLDVLVEPANPVLRGRTFGVDAETVATHGIAFMRGLGDAGVIACGKHFPGHGRTTGDSHHVLPEVAARLDELRAVDGVPFARAIADGIEAIMTAHVRYAALDDDAPATLSQRAVAGLLRRDFDFRGVVVTDDLEMRAIADHYGIEEACTRAIAAGCDLLLICHHLERAEQAYAALVRAEEDDPFLQHRIAESAARIVALKRRHVFDRRTVDPAAAARIVGSAEHRRLAEDNEGSHA